MRRFFILILILLAVAQTPWGKKHTEKYGREFQRWAHRWTNIDSNEGAAVNSNPASSQTATSSVSGSISENPQLEDSISDIMEQRQKFIPNKSTSY